MDIWYGLIIALFFLVAWVGGSHTGMRQCRGLNQAHTVLVTENSKLKQEIDELRALIVSLQSQVDVFQREVDDLSAKLAMMRRDANNQNPIG